MDQAEALRHEAGTLRPKRMRPAGCKGCRFVTTFARVLRPDFPKEQVCAADADVFETASAESAIRVDQSLVMPEDGLHGDESTMRCTCLMVGFFRSALYPKVHVSLHAGEIAHGALCLTRDSAATFRLAVEEAGADAHRAGRGRDV